MGGPSEVSRTVVECEVEFIRSYELRSGLELHG